MTVYAQISLWDYADLMSNVVQYLLSGDTPNTREAARKVDDFLLACCEGFQQLEEEETLMALTRMELRLRALTLLTDQDTHDAVAEMIQETQRRWCHHNDHLAAYGQHDAGNIRGASACLKCWDNYLIEMAEDEAFETEYNQIPPN